MSMFVLFGVETGKDLHVDEVAKWVEKLIGVAPVKRMGEEAGHYCTFQASGAERIKLVTGTHLDEEGEFPVEPKFPDWPFLLYLDFTSLESSWLKNLENAGAPFFRLRTDVTAT